ncbi:DUF7857 domain-containing protein [Haloferax gibbonsii]|uniref:DUF8080 domain-containing protein n=1 Tax=Haloferax gibbonsii TaxID=35746 RepID=A0A0K1IPP4_HALGI|nr:hypothetical protein [Haloferax gibbonsii]AKU06404.1 hypothetical protein ABY42_01085 [Haloferax gibbonsii]
MHSDIDVTVDDGVALVSVRVHNDAPVDRRVRLRNRLDGSVLPPRRAGVPEAGWDDEGFEGVVPAGSTVALGYAVSPSSTATRDTATADLDARPEHAVGIDVLGRADEAERASDSTPDDAVRTLGSARPPADAVPVSSDLPPTTRESETPEPTPSTTSDASDGERREPLPSPEPQTRSERPEPSEQPTDADVSAAVGTSEERGRGTDQSLGSEPPESLESLAAFERRIDLAERLDGASVADAAATLSEADICIDALDALDADRERLRRLAARATALADRATDADPDVDALRRLA